MDQNVLDSIDNQSFEADWEHAEDELIPIDNSYLSDEIREAEIQTDEQVVTEEAHLEESVQQLQELEGALVTGEDNVPDDNKGFSNDTLADVNQDDLINIGTELGLAVYNEGGRVEAPERLIYNDIIESKNESSGNVERLG